MRRHLGRFQRADRLGILEAGVKSREGASVLAKPVGSCRICGSPALAVVFDLGTHALSGSFPLPGDAEVPRAPLQLVRCRACGLVQLGHNVNPEEMYGANYGYRSGLNATMSEHLAGLATQVESMVALRPGDTILDIASNDGTLLKSYRADQRVARVGIDPTIVQYDEYYPPHFIRAAAFFSAGVFGAVSPTPKAKIVTSVAMLYDLPKPEAFIADVASILDAEGVWVLEQSDVGSMLATNAFDAICHEHLEYYSVAQIRGMLERHGLRVINVQHNSSNGGSVRLTACHQGARYPTEGAALAASDSRERELRVADADSYYAFAARAAHCRQELLGLLSRLAKAEQRVHIYGASTKGNTLLQFCGIDVALIEAASERNPFKWGRRTPGSDIPIISEAESRARNPDYLLVLPWHFRDEFIVRESAFIDAGGKLIFPLPTLSVYP